MSWNPNTEFKGTQDDFLNNVMTQHDAVCPGEFTNWRNSSWQVCGYGHTYWTDGSSWWCRPWMRGHEL